MFLRMEPNQEILQRKLPNLYNFPFSRFEPIHNILNLEEFEQILLNIFNYKASVNFYMFHGWEN